MQALFMWIAMIIRKEPLHSADLKTQELERIWETRELSPIFLPKQL